jgi:hypothetical protein
MLVASCMMPGDEDPWTECNSIWPSWVSGFCNLNPEATRPLCIWRTGYGSSSPALQSWQSSIAVLATDFLLLQNVHTSTGRQPARGKAARVWNLTTKLQLVPWLRMSDHAVRLHGMQSKNFTFLFNSKPNRYCNGYEQADSFMLLHIHAHEHTHIHTHTHVNEYTHTHPLTWTHCTN